MSFAETDVVYPDLDDILAFHAEIFGLDEPSQAADRLLNPGGLEAAIQRPRQYAYYQGADLALQAAVLAHGIAEGQCFIDGNKRTAAISLVAFLRFNGFGLGSSKPQLAAWMLAFSVGLSPDALAVEMRPWLHRRTEAG